MINWLNVFYNALWILGLAIILAAFSYADWRARLGGKKLRQRLNSALFQFPLSIGLLLVSLSLLLLAQVWWERLIWLVFGGLFLFQGWQSRSERGG
ncbi:MAG TPA: hypothetical protein G4N96_12610 [Chloroflexi bacterium]|nr:hypothetical protein [Chloroflexota bacterium]